MRCEAAHSGLWPTRLDVQALEVKGKKLNRLAQTSRSTS